MLDAVSFHNLIGKTKITICDLWNNSGEHVCFFYIIEFALFVFQLAADVAKTRANPTRAKKLYILGGIMVSIYSGDLDARVSKNRKNAWNKLPTID